MDDEQLRRLLNEVSLVSPTTLGGPAAMFPPHHQPLLPNVVIANTDASSTTSSNALSAFPLNANMTAAADLAALHGGSAGGGVGGVSVSSDAAGGAGFDANVTTFAGLLVSDDEEDGGAASALPMGMPFHALAGGHNASVSPSGKGVPSDATKQAYPPSGGHHHNHAATIPAQAALPSYSASVAGGATVSATVPSAPSATTTLSKLVPSSHARGAGNSPTADVPPPVVTTTSAAAASSQRPPPYHLAAAAGGSPVVQMHGATPTTGTSVVPSTSVSPTLAGAPPPPYGMSPSLAGTANAFDGLLPPSSGMGIAGRNGGNVSRHSPVLEVYGGGVPNQRPQGNISSLIAPSTAAAGESAVASSYNNAGAVNNTADIIPTNTNGNTNALHSGRSPDGSPSLMTTLGGLNTSSMAANNNNAGASTTNFVEPIIVRNGNGVFLLTPLPQLQSAQILAQLNSHKGGEAGIDEAYPALGAINGASPSANAGTPMAVGQHLPTPAAHAYHNAAGRSVGTYGGPAATSAVAATPSTRQSPVVGGMPPPYAAAAGTTPSHQKMTVNNNKSGVSGPGTPLPSCPLPPPASPFLGSAMYSGGKSGAAGSGASPPPPPPKYPGGGDIGSTSKTPTTQPHHYYNAGHVSRGAAYGASPAAYPSYPSVPNNSLAVNPHSFAGLPPPAYAVPATVSAAAQFPSQSPPAYGAPKMPPSYGR